MAANGIDNIASMLERREGVGVRGEGRDTPHVAVVLYAGKASSSVREDVAKIEELGVGSPLCPSLPTPSSGRLREGGEDDSVAILNHLADIEKSIGSASACIALVDDAFVSDCHCSRCLDAITARGVPLVPVLYKQELVLEGRKATECHFFLSGLQVVLPAAANGQMELSQLLSVAGAVLPSK
mmetsp:Transcript_15576/g.39480  ORF Transcript_15576/g.39480 Transcript_15576/m.39480 type:complete len:183 (-) Transcript_15576:52-600(-)